MSRVRSAVALSALLAALFGATLGACGDGRTREALCLFCENDAQCGGNPCFEDVSGQRFCGAPCGGGCPVGYACRTLVGTTGLKESCFPDSEACMAPTLPPGEASDAGPPPMVDGRSPPIIVAGPVGPSGGTVDRLVFGITGDTRPAVCGGSYPRTIIRNIFTAMKDKGVQFALDQGDHMFNCGFPIDALQRAEAQMAEYVDAAALLGKTVFMTMGNHECTGAATALCTLGTYGSNPNYTAYMDALRSVADRPYYRFDVKTSTGLAVFIVIADDVWDATQEAWLRAQLTEADQTAKYTIVSKHHPDGNDDWPQFQRIYDLVRQHKYSLFLTGHSHLYKRQPRDGRALVMGTGGAPLTGGDFWGYGVVKQGADDKLSVTIYDQATGNVRDSFSVSPQ